MYARSGGYSCGSCLFFVLFIVFVLYVAKRALVGTEGLIDGAASFASFTETSRASFSLPRASMPSSAQHLVDDLLAEATRVANGQGSSVLETMLAPGEVVALTRGALEAADGVRERVRMMEMETGTQAATAAMTEAACIGTHVMPTHDPTYFEARVVYTRGGQSAPIRMRTVYGDQIWRGWLVPGDGTGTCVHCGAPLRLDGPQTCEYCGAQSGQEVWKVLQIDKTAASDAYLASLGRDLTGRSMEAATRSGDGFASRAVTSSSRVAISGNGDIAVFARDLEQSLGEGAELRER